MKSAAARHADGTQGEREAVAIVGMACRFPGAPDTAAFWRLLRNGSSAISDDWPGRGGEPPAGWAAAAARFGAYLADVAAFDADFFGISPAEASAMDPQQRLTLELAWEAFEDAGIVPAAADGAGTGVFIGAIRNDYAALTLRMGLDAIGRYTMTGEHRSMIANRVSYILGLHGPSLTVDTGQSSSAAAFHMACENLRSGECSLALAGGVNLNITPDSAISAERFGGLSPAGRCFTFDARANGFVRGEGGGVVVLKLLRDAVADGDDVYCVVRGSALNNDGGGPGLTVPSSAAQQDVLSLAYQRAGVDPASVQYVELHGTGTPAGDPVEAAALGSVLGTARQRTTPLRVGSVKTNIGHLEGAAGIAGLIKTVLCLQHRELPASLNFETPHPRIPLDALGLHVQRELGPWPAGDQPLTAGVSSFGMGGTNCHIVLTQSPAVPAVAAPAPASADLAVWPISARTGAALRAQAARLGAFADATPELDLAAAGASLAGTRSRFEHRAVILASGRAGLRRGLERLSGGEAAPSGGGAAASAGDPAVAVVEGTATGDSGPVAFVFPAESMPAPGPAAELLDSSAPFRDQLLACSDALRPHLGWAVTDVLRGTRRTVPLDRPEAADPVSFAIMAGLAGLWRSAGVLPAAVLGTGAGYVAAAYVAGWLSLADAAAVIALRSRLLAADATAALAAADIAQLANLHGGDRQAPGVAGYAPATGERLETADLDAGHWLDGLRAAPLSETAIQAMAADGHRIFVELSTLPVIVPEIERLLGSQPGPAVTACGSLHRGQGGWNYLLASAARLYVRGVAVSWPALGPSPATRRVKLPTYPFQRRRHWVDGRAADRDRAESAPDPGRAPVSLPPPGQLLDMVRRHAAAALGHDETGTLNPDRSFHQLGFDSLTAAEFASRLAAETGLTLPATLTYDFPTPEAVAGHLVSLRSADHIAQPEARPAKTPPADTVTSTVRTSTTSRPRPPAEPCSWDEPVAVVGVGCRFAGGVGCAEDLWEVVAGGRDVVSGFPADRQWPGGLAGEFARAGGFIEDAGGFDAGFFGISPREALAMDPQQRLLLEVTWEAVEQAGLDPESLRGTAAGVFAGVIGQEYGPRMHEAPAELAGYLMTGSTASVASGRVAYALGLRGPAVTIDTACSSSLVAIHLACQALRAGECSLALAGGVTVMAAPGMFTEFARQQGLARDGRCKPFAAAADGTSWGEGAGVLVLERLSEATAAGHRIVAVIRGSAVNQDGASNGLTAPSGPAQQQVIRQALAAAGLGPGDIDAIEAHGTGTALGDPIEARALASAYSPRPPGRPLLLRSVKSNIGHTQAAAGAAGVITMIMAIRHGLLPHTLHIDAPTPHVDWAAGPLRLLTHDQPWPAAGRPRRAAISSFGISGTNAHLILEQPPAPAPAPDGAAGPGPGQDTGQDPGWPGPVTWPVSAKTPAALAAWARNLQQLRTRHPQLPAAAIGDALATTRTAFTHRAVIIAPDPARLDTALTALAGGQDAPGLVRGTPGPPGATAFLFSGQGSQRPGMGRQLSDTFPVFARALADACDCLDPGLPDGSPPLRDIMFAGPGTARAALLNQTAYTQAALFAYQSALYRLLEHLGPPPSYLLGHSIGEITAAHAAGVLSLPDTATLVTARGTLMQSLPPGAMAVIEATETELAPHLHHPHAAIAAVNAPRSLVISGDTATIENLSRHWKAQGRRVIFLNVSHAFHSPHMDPILDDFRAVAGTLTYHQPAIPLISNLTGQPVTPGQLTPAYWTRHIRQPVRFADAIRHLATHDTTAYLEITPQPTLTPLITASLPATHPQPLITSTHHRGRPEPTALLTALAHAHTHGLPVHWPRTHPPATTQHIPLPTYPFQHQHYWLTPAPPPPAQHPLTGTTIPLADSGQILLSGEISLDRQPWLADHVMAGTVMLPGTALVELALHAAGQAGAGYVGELTLEAPLRLPRMGVIELQVRVDPVDDSDRRALVIHARPAPVPDDEQIPADWTRLASGTLAAGPPEAPAPADAEWPPPGASPVDVDDLYDRLAAAGYEYGAGFRGVRAAWQSGEDIYADVELPAGAQAEAGRFGLHPALFDAALHPLVLTGLLAGDGQGRARIPFSWSGVRLYARGATAVRVMISPAGPDSAMLALYGPDGEAVAMTDSLTLLASTPSRGHGPPADLYQLRWDAATTPADPLPPDAHALLTADGPGGGNPGAGPPLRRYPSLAAVLDATAGGSPAPAVLVAELSGLAGQLPGCLPEQAEAMTQRARELVQEFLASAELAGSRLVIVTQGALAVRPGERVRTVAQAGVWGMVRAAESERPGRLILADTDDTVASRNAITSLAATGEPQVAIRDGELLVPRLGRADPADELVPPSGTAAWRLDAPDRNGPDGLVLAPWPEAEQALGPGQVRVELRAAGLNFRDALISLGIYPGTGRIGSEGAGIVTEVAADVTGVVPGDRVMGLFDGIGPVAVTSRSRLVPIPRGWSFAQASAVPLVFVTAYLALRDMAKLQPGESVLIHAATGGVGMAALQLARHWQGEPYATASTAKWPALDALGLDGQHIASSRTLEFEPRFLTATRGRGVNVVLNSLAGEFTDASMRLLVPGGRFIELGKTDLRDPRDVAVAHPRLSYQPLNLADVPEQRIQQVLSELHAMFEAGTLRPLPVTAWHVRQAREAVHHLARARHTGKLVLTFPVPLDGNGTVLIAGGTGTLGACVARQLVARHGARHLLLASRSGPAADGAAEIVADLSELGAEVTVAACDTADRTAVENLLGSIPARHPLTAVIHLAGQLDDVPVADLTAAQLAAVFRPKVRTAWNLHELTRDHDLSAFVMFSSVVGLLGLPGQANYAAANTVLDALACHRHLAGLPATALAWGLWAGDTGMTRHLTTQDLARMRRHGVAAMPTDEALALFGDMLQASQPTLVPVRLDRHALRSRDATVPVLLTGLVGSRRPAVSGTSLAQRLSARDEAGQRSILLKLIRDNAAVALGHANPGAMDTSRTFRQLGFDSLTAIEFRNRLAAETGLNLPATLTFDFPTPVGLATRLREEIVPAAIPDVESITAGLDQLELAVARAGVDDSDYATIKLRLQSIVNKMDSYRCPLNENGKEADDLSLATDEELFAALDEEIGPPRATERPARRADSRENRHGE